MVTVEQLDFKETIGHVKYRCTPAVTEPTLYVKGSEKDRRGARWADTHEGHERSTVSGIRCCRRFTGLLGHVFLITSLCLFVGKGSPLMDHVWPINCFAPRL